jgi:hypothetical protein
MLKHTDRFTSLHYMEEILSYLALERWNDVDSANVFNLLSATYERRSTRRAHLLRLQTIEDQTIIRPVSQQVCHLRETHVCGVCRCIQFTSLRVASEDFGIPNIGQLFRAQIEDDWGPEVCRLVLGYVQNVLMDSICIIFQNGLLYYRQPFHCPTAVEHLEHD